MPSTNFLISNILKYSRWQGSFPWQKCFLVLATCLVKTFCFGLISNYIFAHCTQLFNLKKFKIWAILSSYITSSKKISGPAIGAFLYEIGGFKLPFFAVGAFGMVVATCLLFVIPNVKIEERRSNAKSLNYSEVVRVNNDSDFFTNQ